jgi:hypothetical protein
MLARGSRGGCYRSPLSEYLPGSRASLAGELKDRTRRRAHPGCSDTAKPISIESIGGRVLELGPSVAAVIVGQRQWMEAALGRLQGPLRLASERGLPGQGLDVFAQVLVELDRPR